MKKGKTYSKIDFLVKLDNYKLSRIIKMFSTKFTCCNEDYRAEELFKEIKEEFDIALDSVFGNELRLGYKYEEELLDSLFREIPENNDVSQVLLKVVALNQIYSTMLPNNSNDKALTILEMSKRIKNISDNSENFCDVNKALTYVKEIADDESANRYKAYSFASKYLSFSFRARGEDAVPITDKNARKAMSILIGASAYSLEEYETFFKRVSELKSSLTDVTFKELDIFLWLLGKGYQSQKTKLNHRR